MRIIHGSITHDKYYKYFNAFSYNDFSLWYAL